MLLVDYLPYLLGSQKRLPTLIAAAMIAFLVINLAFIVMPSRYSNRVATVLSAKSSQQKNPTQEEDKVYQQWYGANGNPNATPIPTEVPQPTGVVYYSPGFIPRIPTTFPTPTPTRKPTPTPKSQRPTYPTPMYTTVQYVSPTPGAVLEPDPGVVCAQVITYAQDPQTGECKEFPTPCDVPQGWQTSPNQCSVSQ